VALELGPRHPARRRVSHLGTITAADQVTTISQKGGWLPNLEFGLRYMFL